MKPVIFLSVFGVFGVFVFLTLFWFLSETDVEMKSQGSLVGSAHAQMDKGNPLGGAISIKGLPKSILRVLPKSPDDQLLLDIAGGHSFFSLPWVKPPASTRSRDGLGPLFNARNCIKCHEGGGRGRAPEMGEPMRNMLIRLSVPGENDIHGVSPEPMYGKQLQMFGIERSEKGLESYENGGFERTIGEATVTAEYEKVSRKYPDGESVELRKPVFKLDNLGYGAMSEGVLTSPRIGPSLVGMGLIELIPEDEILALEDSEDKNSDGISGRANRVWSVENKKNMLGRYGLKANTPTLRQQVADAFVNDIGITSSLFPKENCGEKQKTCRRGRHGRGPRSADEIDDEILGKVVTLVRYMPVPYTPSKDKESIKAGKRYFMEAGCQLCHHSSFTTVKAENAPLLSEQTIHPYSDFLLHDMGEGLSDNRPDFNATGREWRTPPLWGLAWRQRQGAFNNYLHDGRASSVEEAILWHGGEAEAARRHFEHLNKNQRERLLSFVESL